jgi:hypothetical protein
MLPIQVSNDAIGPLAPDQSDNDKQNNRADYGVDQGGNEAGAE